MILLEIKKYFQDKPTASLLELSQQLQKTPDTVRLLLEPWLRKGKLRVLSKPPGCGTRCGNCPELYQWVSDEATQTLNHYFSKS